MRQSGALLLLACLLFSPAAAPSQRPSTESEPAFKVGTRLVEVFVVARDKKGPAAGLIRDDFTLLDNGQPREIAFFSTSSARDATSPPAVGSAAPLLPGTISNRPSAAEDAPASHTILLLDQIFTPPADQVFAISRVGKFLDLRRKADGIGIYTLGRKLSVVQDVTADQDLLRRAANSLKARDATTRTSDTTGMSPKEAAAYQALTLQERVTALKNSLEAIARHLADIPGRKNLVWITEAFPLFICNDLICVDFRPDMNEAARALNDANVAVYASDARGLIGALSGMTPIPNAEVGPRPPGQVTQIMRNWAAVPAGPSHIETMNFVAGLTGGDVFHDTNGLEDSFKKAVDDGDAAYLLGFYPPTDSQDGQVHRLTVKIARSGVSLRYRENYLAPKPGSDAESRPASEQLLKDPLDARQIGLLARATPDTAHAGLFSVHVSIDLHDVQLYPQDSKYVGAVEISFFVENSKTAQITTRAIEIPEDQLALALERGIGFDHPIELQGKAGLLRVVVEDKATGRAGSLAVPLGVK
jgi:VWFA-related protein